MIWDLFRQNLLWEALLFLLIPRQAAIADFPTVQLQEVLWGRSRAHRTSPDRTGPRRRMDIYRVRFHRWLYTTRTTDRYDLFRVRMFDHLRRTKFHQEARMSCLPQAGCCGLSLVVGWGAGGLAAEGGSRKSRAQISVGLSKTHALRHNLMHLRPPPCTCCAAGT